MILVMGGAGYIGSHTVKHLIENGYDVLVADNLVSGHREAVDKKAKFVLADLMDKNSLDYLFKNNNIVERVSGMISFNQCSDLVDKYLN